MECREAEHRDICEKSCGVYLAFDGSKQLLLEAKRPGQENIFKVQVVRASQLQQNVA